jgi:hypothetical protein
LVVKYGTEHRFTIKGRTLHVTRDNPNKVWLDVYTWVFYGSLLESYEVLIADDKVESYRRDYPDAQMDFTVLRCRSASGHGFS